MLSSRRLIPAAVFCCLHKIILDNHPKSDYTAIVRLRTEMEGVHMDAISRQMLLEFNAAMKHVDDVYRRAVRQCGLSECAFWILYTLRVDETAYTQAEICKLLHEPKQTVNSALKKLEAAGVLSLSAGDDQRSKRVRLTPKGEQLARSNADRVAEAEARAIGSMSPDDRAAFIRLTELYGTLLAGQLPTKK